MRQIFNLFPYFVVLLSILRVLIQKNSIEKNELYDKLNDCKDRLKVLKDDLNEVNIDLENDFESYKTFYEEVIQKSNCENRRSR